MDFLQEIKNYVCFIHQKTGRTTGSPILLPVPVLLFPVSVRQSDRYTLSQVILVHIAIFVQLWSIYIPVCAITGILYINVISIMKLTNLIGCIVSLGISKCQIIGSSCHIILWATDSNWCNQVILIDITIFIQLIRIYIPVTAVTAVDNLYCISCIQLSDLIAVIVCLLCSQCKVTSCHTYCIICVVRNSTIIQIVIVHVSVSVQLG